MSGKRLLLDLRCLWVAIVTLGGAFLEAQETSGANTVLEGVLAVRGDRVVATANVDRLFVPASVQKVLLATALLDALGPDYRIETRLHAGGPRKGNVLDGDLIVEAAGDPTWSEEFLAKEPRARLREVAKALVDSGIETINGDLVIDVRSFPGRDWPRSRPAADLGLGFSAPTSGFALEENTVQIEIAPGLRIGSAGRLAGPSELELINRMTTVSSERDGRGTVEFRPIWGTDTVIVDGEYPISEKPFRVAVSVPDANRHAARALLEELRAAGIQVTGGLRLLGISGDRTADPAGREEARPPLVSVVSPPLSEILVPVLTDSSNWLAEMLLRVLAREVTGEGRIDSGLEELERFLVEEVGVEKSTFVLDDGSGLSQYNLVSPRTLVEVLRYAWRQPWRDSLLEALADPKEGTLRFWPALPPVAAKTGTLRDTVALAGVLHPASETPVFFAWIVNHEVERKRDARQRIAAALHRWSVE